MRSGKSFIYTPKTNERRQEKRAVLSMPCAFSVEEGVLHRAETRDLAASGIAIKSSIKPKKGAMIHILFDEYGEHTGKISRVFDGGFAVKLPQSSLAVLALSTI